MPRTETRQGLHCFDMVSLSVTKTTRPDLNMIKTGPASRRFPLLASAASSPKGFLSTAETGLSLYTEPIQNVTRSASIFLKNAIFNP